MARDAGGAGHVASYTGCTVMGEVHKGLACAPGALCDSVVIAFHFFAHCFRGDGKWPPEHHK